MENIFAVWKVPRSYRDHGRQEVGLLRCYVLQRFRVETSSRGNWKMGVVVFLESSVSY